MTYAKDTELTFTVTGKATGNGNVTIGCKTFTEGEIGEVAKGLEVKAPPEPDWRPGDVLLLVGGTRLDNGTTYIVGTESYGGGSRRGHYIWSANQGTHSDERYWLSEAGGGSARFVKVASGATDFRTVTNRARDERVRAA